MAGTAVGYLHGGLDRPAELEHALLNLSDCLEQMSATSRLLRFVRVRNPAILERVLSMSGVEKLDGFVFPKVDRRTVDNYMGLVHGTPYLTMPTLETKDAFDPWRMAAFRDHLLEQGFEKRVLALRIGGNDLLSILGIRRPRDMTIYRTPIGHTIAQIVTVFKPYGFELTASVFEHIDRPEILQAEVKEDIAHGLCGKTAIHPSQIPLIEAGYRVAPSDLKRPAASCRAIGGVQLRWIDVRGGDAQFMGTRCVERSGGFSLNFPTRSTNQDRNPYERLSLSRSWLHSFACSLPFLGHASARCRSVGSGLIGGFAGPDSRVMEVSLSFDNAVVNASVLKDMDAKWQQIFLTVGILIAVFGMRLVFPIVIVSVASGQGWRCRAHGAEPSGRIRQASEASHAGIAAFGGMFLLLVFFSYMMDEAKDIHWIAVIERKLASFGKLDSVEVMCALIVLFLLQTLSADR